MIYRSKVIIIAQLTGHVQNVIFIRLFWKNLIETVGVKTREEQRKMPGVRQGGQRARERERVMEVGAEGPKEAFHLPVTQHRIICYGFHTGNNSTRI